MECGSAFDIDPGSDCAKAYFRKGGIDDRWWGDLKGSGADLGSLYAITRGSLS